MRDAHLQSTTLTLFVVLALSSTCSKEERKGKQVRLVEGERHCHYKQQSNLSTRTPKTCNNVANMLAIKGVLVRAVNALSFLADSMLAHMQQYM
jgi:hypothetical protein